MGRYGHQVQKNQRPSLAINRISTLAILGLGRKDVGLKRLRRLQKAPLAARSRLCLIAGLAMAMVAALVMKDYIKPAIILTWLFYLAGICFWAFGQVNRQKIVLRAFREGHVSNPLYHYALMGALAWAAPFWFMGFSPSVAHSLTMWTIILFVMMMFATLAHSLTLACVIFIAPVTLSAMVAVTRSHSFVLALIPLFSGGFLISICLRSASNHLRIRLVEEGLRDNRETVSLLLREFETSADWLWQTDVDHRLEQVSSRLGAAVGASAALIEGMPFLPILNGGEDRADYMPDDLLALHKLMEERKSFANFTASVFVNGEQKWWQFSAAPRRDSSDDFIGYRGVGSDVTQQHNNAEHIARLARLDALTGLPNRLCLYEDLEKALADCSATHKRCALIIIDLDRFKSVNDSLGHPTGDRLLAEVAERLQNLMGKNCSCGRLGGDEFAVVMRNLSHIGAAEALGRNIIAMISRPYLIDGHQLFVGASAGFAIGLQDGSTVEEITRNADLALYRSKDRGGNQVAAYVPSLHAQAEERLAIEQELRGALDRRELEIAYQPVVNAKNEKLVGFEALLRWNSAKLGMVLSNRFIPVAEESRLIGPIGEWVLRMACHEAMSWPKPLKIAVNVSPEQLTDPNFTAMVVSALAQSGLPPHRLEMEVTESVFVRDGGGAAQILDQLLAIGVHLSLDDFGTGYSSLGYLRKARFSTIKIDRSFISSAAEGSMESIAIVRAIVALAEGLGMSTTAEGVETREEMEVIRSLGCRNIQGFLYGRPMKANEVISIFADDNRPVARA